MGYHKERDSTTNPLHMLYIHSNSISRKIRKGKQEVKITFGSETGTLLGPCKEINAPPNTYQKREERTVEYFNLSHHRSHTRLHSGVNTSLHASVCFLSNFSESTQSKSGLFTFRRYLK